MKTFHRIIGALVVLVLVGAMVFPKLVAAGQYESLTPLLINLNGWEAEVPQGMDMDMGGMKMIQAMREYAKGNQSLKAMVMVGNSMMAQGQRPPKNIETSEDLLKTQTIDGFQVMLQHAKRVAEGAVVVSLSGADQKGAQFILHYTGLKSNEAIDMAKKFDWQKMQKTAAEME